MSTLWCYQLGGKEVGPISSAELKSLAIAGMIQHQTPVRNASGDRWHLAGDVQGLFHADSEKAPTAVKAPVAARGEFRTAVAAQTASPADVAQNEGYRSAPTALNLSTMPPASPQADARFGVSSKIPEVSMTSEVCRAVGYAPSDGQASGGRLRMIGIAAAVAIVAFSVTFWLGMRGGDDGASPASVSVAEIAGPARSSSTAAGSPAKEAQNVPPAPPSVSETPAAPAAEPLPPPKRDDSQVPEPASPKGGQKRPSPAPATVEEKLAPRAEEKGSLAAPAAAPAASPASNRMNMPASRQQTSETTPPREPISAQAGPDRRLLRLRQIFDQVQATAVRQKEATAKAREKDLEDKGAKAKRDALAVDLQTNRQQQNNLKLEKLQKRAQNGGRLPSAIKSAYDALEKSLQQEEAALMQQIAIWDAQIPGLAPDAKAAQDQAAELSAGLPAGLADEWFWLCDPFARLPAAMHERALVSFSNWPSDKPGFAPLHLAQGFANLALKHYEEADRDLDRAERIEPKLDFLCAAARGLVHAKRGESREANADFGKAGKLTSKSVIVELFVAYGSLAQRKPKDAEDHFKRALNLGKKSPQANEALARFLVTRRADNPRSVKLAAQYAKNAAELTNYEDWMVLDTLAMCLAASGDREQAAEYSGKALRLAPAECQPAVRANLARFQSGAPSPTR
jgi:tetratricopeptide (TPR) repeat protein